MREGDATMRDGAGAKDAWSFWEPHYAAMRPGSVGPNAVLVDVAGRLAAGRALDLGCGHGGDAFWLAGRGWGVTAVDVSATVLDQVAQRAAEAGLAERVHAVRHDLTASVPQGRFDLVSAQYFHSPVAMDRPAVLARAAAAVDEGGMLLVVDHASIAPWSWADPDTVFPTPRQALTGLGLDLHEWDAVRTEDRDRVAEGPGGQRATVTDTIIALIRRPGGHT